MTEATTQALLKQIKTLEHQLEGAQASLLFMARRIGQFEQQRNRAREKLGRGKRRWREERAVLNNEIKALEARLELTSMLLQNKRAETQPATSETPAA